MSVDDSNPYATPKFDPQSVRDQPRQPTRERLRREYMLLVAFVAVVFLLPLLVVWVLSRL